MFEDYLHVEGEMLRYLDPPKNEVEHHQWLKKIYYKLDDFKRQGLQPRDYVLLELQGRGEHNRAITKLVWRKKEKA